MNYYQILGVSINTPLSEIKKKYKELCKIHHPDKGGNNDYFLSIKNAYDNIVDDISLNALTYNYDISLELEINVSIIYLNENYELKYFRMIDNKQIVETITIANTFMIKHDNKIVYKEYGNSYNNKQGNLYITFKIKENPKYVRKSKNIHIHLPVEISTAIYGGTADYTHIDGKIYSISIPARINNNHLIKMSNMGMIYNTLNQRGDLIINIQLYIDYSDGKYK